MDRFESLQSPTFALIGAGAVGCYYGGRLAQNGQNIHFLLRSDYDHVRQRGLNIKSCEGDFRLAPENLKIYRDPADMPKADVVLVTLKTTANHQFESLLAPLLHPSTIILTLQNGLGNEQQLADLFGEHRVLGGMCFVCINRLSPGEIHHSDYGLIKIGEFRRNDGITPRLEKLSAIFNASNVKCQMLQDLRHGRWEKLIWNIPFNGLGAAMGWTTDRIMAHPEGVELARRLMLEVISAAKADGVHLDPQLVDDNLARTRAMTPYRSSMQLDQDAGRPIELDAIIRQPLLCAKRHGIPTPTIETLYQILAIAAEKR